MTKTAWGPDTPGYDGKCPVPPGTDCTVYFRKGHVARNTNPQFWTDWWDHSPRGSHPDHDIIAYERHDAPDQARELLAEAREQLNDTSSLTGNLLWQKSLGNLVDRIDAYLKGAD